MDSISTIQLVDFLEKEFSVQFKPHEVDQDNLNTIELITRCVEGKLRDK
jgi:acyl carrier protein